MTKKLFLFIFICSYSTLIQSQEVTTQGIVWSKNDLTWNDFREENSYDKYPYKLAKTHWELKVVAEDSCKCETQKLSVKVYALFIPDFSWVRESAIKNKAVLAHEQLHFDIVEVFARRLRKQLQQLKATHNDYQKLTDREKRKTLRALRSVQEDYDQETSGGNKIMTQQKWKNKIDNNLAELDTYQPIQVFIQINK